jgi:hypothetical protein
MAAIAIAVGAALYNLLARIIGGVEVDLVPSGDASPPAGSSLSGRAPDRPAHHDSDVVWTPVPSEYPPSSSTTQPPGSFPKSSEQVDPDSRWKPPAGS